MARCRSQDRMAPLQGRRAHLIPITYSIPRSINRHGPSYDSSVSIPTSFDLLNIYLPTSSSSQLSLSTLSAQAQEREIKGQSTTLSILSDSVQAQQHEIKGQSTTVSVISNSIQAINQSFEQIKATCATTGELSQQILASIESAKNLLM